MSINRVTLGSALATVAAATTQTLTTSPFTARNLVQGVIDPSFDFEGVVKIQGSDDNSTWTDLMTLDVNTNAFMTRPLSLATLAISATAENYQVGAHQVLIHGVPYAISADTDEALVAAKTIAASKFGVFLISVDSSGGLTSTPAADAMAYDTAAEALAAMPACPTDECPVGYILIANNGSLWTSVTDDLTNASDVTTATFVAGLSNLGSTYTIPRLQVASLTLQRYMRANVTERRAGSVNVYLDAA